MKGCKKVDSDPDMMVVYFASTGIDIDFRSWGLTSTVGVYSGSRHEQVKVATVRPWTWSTREKKRSFARSRQTR